MPFPGVGTQARGRSARKGTADPGRAGKGRGVGGVTSGPRVRRTSAQWRESQVDLEGPRTGTGGRAFDKISVEAQEGLDNTDNVQPLRWADLRVRGIPPTSRGAGRTPTPPADPSSVARREPGPAAAPVSLRSLAGSLGVGAHSPGVTSSDVPRGIHPKFQH